MKPTEQERQLYKAMLDTANMADIKIMSDDYCCQLLAWTYAYGGGVEAVVYNVKLNTEIKHAQERLNIMGGCIPNVRLLPLLQKYIKETKTGLKKDMPDWAKKIGHKYNIR